MFKKFDDIAHEHGMSAITLAAYMLAFVMCVFVLVSMFVSVEAAAIGCFVALISGFVGIFSEF